MHNPGIDPYAIPHALSSCAQLRAEEIDIGPGSKRKTLSNTLWRQWRLPKQYFMSDSRRQSARSSSILGTSCCAR